MRDGTLCLLVRGDPPDRVLLGRKKRGFGSGKWGAFGGKIEVGETCVGSAVRELQEEAGVIAAESDLSYVARLYCDFPSRPEWSQLVHVFVCANWRGEPVETSEMVPCWFGRQELPLGQMWDDGAYWLLRILAGERLSARFTFGPDNERVVRMEEGPSCELSADGAACADSTRELRATDE